jgi:quinoprotein glucose dehydrogenase
MQFSTEPSQAEPRRYLIAAVLGLIGLLLLIGGIRLVALGGSVYYGVAGLAVMASAYLLARGDRRGIWLYGAMLFGTVIWALAEVGLDLWGLQARLVAPFVLGIWVTLPYVRRLPRALLVVALFLAIALPGIALFWADRTEAPQALDAALPSNAADWTQYGYDLAGTRFSPATQVTPANVHALERAWSFQTGVKDAHMGFEATPLMVDGTLYLCTPNNIVFAVDPDTGERRWIFDPKVEPAPIGTCRGVAYYKVPDATGPCAKRIISATTDARLFAVDADTGTLCTGFGNNGMVDLKPGMGRVGKAYYYISSAPAIVHGKVIFGGWVMDGQYVNEPPGVIRAFDAVTGKFAWAWDMARPHDHGEPSAGETYTLGTPNSWGPISGDEALGLVYLPTGNSTPDYWGGYRTPVEDKYSSSVVALDADTGELRWSYQTVHHDIWDYDVAAQPTLIDLPVNGEVIPALVEGTKTGQIFLLDRRTGVPLSRIEERRVSQVAASGERPSPTQPFSADMPSFDSTVFTESYMWGATPLDQLWCRIKFREAQYEGPFTPPGVRPSIQYPSATGGIEWGGVSVDPNQHLMVVNWNRMANYNRLVPRADVPDIRASTDGRLHVGAPLPQLGTPFAAYAPPFLSPLDIPCQEPPYGKIGVVDLTTHKLVWSRPLGSAADSGPFGLRSRLPLPMGVPNIGGSVVTRSGLVFIAATQERAIRAFELRTGRLLWEASLPAGGHATPMTYVSPRTGRQYIVIDAGGSVPLGSGSGDYVTAFALPPRD